MVEKFLHATDSDIVADIDRLESCAGAPVIRYSRVLTSPLPRNRREKRLASGTSRTGIRIATSDDEDLSEGLVEVEWRGESVLIHRERLTDVGILPTKPLGQPYVNVWQPLLVPTDKGVAKLAPTHTVIAQENHHRVIQDSLLFHKLELLQHVRVHRRDTVHVIVAHRICPEKSEVRHTDESPGEVHGVIEDSLKAQLGTGAVLHVESE